MAGGHRQGFLQLYDYRARLILPVAMILAMMFFIFFRCRAISRAGASV